MCVCVCVCVFPGTFPGVTEILSENVASEDRIVWNCLENTREHPNIWCKKKRCEIISNIKCADGK